MNVAEPFRPLIARLTPEARAEVHEEALADPKSFSDSEALTLPFEIGTGTKP